MGTEGSGLYSQAPPVLPGPMKGTVVPKADGDGNPIGFDANAPSLVHVDPDEDDGGIVVDMSKVSRKKLAAASAEATEPHEVYYALGAEETPVPPKEENVMPLPAVKVTEVSPDPVASPPQTDPPTSTLSGGDVDQLMSGMAAMMSKISQLEGRQEVTPEPPAPEEPEEPEKPSDDFSMLEMPFITGSTPERARQVVYFDMGVLGNMMSRYHAVIEGHDCVALIYDTRYEDGQQWVPPDRGSEPFELNIDHSKKTLLCSSLGLHFNVGVLDITVLIKNSEIDPTQEDNDFGLRPPQEGE